jgi:hypothetical protein
VDDPILRLKVQLHLQLCKLKCFPTLSTRISHRWNDEIYDFVNRNVSLNSEHSLADSTPTTARLFVVNILLKQTWNVHKSFGMHASFDKFFEF